MDALAFFLAQHARLHAADVAEERTLAERVFGGLTDEQLRLRPVKGSNSLAWLLWHMARTEDAAVNAVVISAGSMSDAICQSPPSEAVKKWLNGTTSPDGSITYFSAVARLTVDSCMPMSSPTSARVSGTRCRTPLTR